MTITTTTPRALTDDERIFYRGRLIPKGVCAHFTIDGNTFDVLTGQTAQDKHANVINKLMFWNFTEQDAKAIAKTCGVNVKISKD